MKQVLKIIGLLTTMAFLLTSYQNCSNSDSIKSNQSELLNQDQSSLDPGDKEQAPMINCKIKDSGGSTLRIISTLPQNESNSGSVKQNQALNLDCSETSDSGTLVKGEGVENLKFSVSKSTDGTDNYISMEGAKTNIVFDDSTDYIIKIKVVNKLGLITIKVLTVIVQCPDNLPPAKIDTKKIQISMNELGFFDYHAETAVSDGKPPYVYSWDFNGDGIFDLYDLLTPKQWSNNGFASHVYTNFSGVRWVGLRVKDSCNRLVGPVYVQTDFDQKGFANHKMPITAPLSLEKSFHYLQGDISPKGDLSSDTAKTSNVNFFGTYISTGNSPIKRVICSYNELSYLVGKSSFQIDAINFYDKGNSPDQAENPNLIHGMSLVIDDIPDKGLQGKQDFSSTDALQPIRLSRLNYFVSESEDGSPKNKYSLADKCTVAFHVRREDAQVPCDNDPTKVKGSNNKALIMTGEFTCPSLSSANAGFKPLKVEHGYFFCEVKTANQCVGAPCTIGNCAGNGGGIPPIPE